MLLAARARRLHPAYVSHLLDDMGLPDIQYHPGYQLRVQSLGAFRVWRGSSEIAPRDWQRDKARQLFQLMLTERGRWLPREQIADRLWPQLSPEAAGRDFKVALNALNKAIEPGHSSEAPFCFLAREGTSYQLRPEADIWVDSTEFERECEAGMRLLEAGARSEAVERLQSALRLYKGDYLPDALYEDWASDERERLLSLFLRAADQLAEAYVESARYDEALEVCQRILARDPCWERAYRMMMVSHARQGNRSLATRAYQRCVEALREELGAEPSPATTTLYRQVLEPPAVE
jgi:DNA-binding SARP family transcriptional activator